MAKKKVTQIGSASPDRKMQCIAFLRDLLMQVESGEMVTFGVVAVASSTTSGPSVCFKGSINPEGPTNRELQVLIAELEVLKHDLLVELVHEEREGEDGESVV
jgi:hypothetical protein